MTRRAGLIHNSMIGLAMLTAPLAASTPDCATIDTLDGFAANSVPPEGATCATYLTQAAQTGTSCQWQHAYRDSAARDAAAVLWQAITNCRAGRQLDADHRVNHPDSYDLRQWTSARGIYGLSVKDKAALNRTVVFLRLEPRAPSN